MKKRGINVYGRDICQHWSIPLKKNERKERKEVLTFEVISHGDESFCLNVMLTQFSPALATSLEEPWLTRKNQLEKSEAGAKIREETTRVSSRSKLEAAPVQRRKED